MTLNEWIEQTVTMNEGVELQRGQRVVDYWGSTGIVVKIEKPPAYDHGLVYVWRDDKQGHGADNCDHCPYNNWQRLIRVIEDPFE